MNLVDWPVRLKEKLEIRDDVSKYILASSIILLIFSLVMLTENKYDFNQSNSRVDAGIDGDIVNVTINRYRAVPSRPEIESRDGIRFVNNASYHLEIDFEGDRQVFTIEPSSYKVINLNNSLYYDVKAINNSNSFREITAGIKVN